MSLIPGRALDVEGKHAPDADDNEFIGGRICDAAPADTTTTLVSNKQQELTMEDTWRVYHLYFNKMIDYISWLVNLKS